MRIIRIFFSKTGEASYISHLDLQRVMARALRRSGLPVWYSKGFNPHIYMSFSLPLPLMHQSIAETMDCKTELELEDFSGFVQPLNAALPRGLKVNKIAFPVYDAKQMGSAEYKISYPGMAPKEVAEAARKYGELPQAMVLRKTKRTEQEVDMKEIIPRILPVEEEPSFLAAFPAGNQLTINPDLLTGLLEREFGLSAAMAAVLRTQVYTVDGKAFC